MQELVQYYHNRKDELMSFLRSRNKDFERDFAGQRIFSECMDTLPVINTKVYINKFDTEKMEKVTENITNGNFKKILFKKNKRRGQSRGGWRRCRDSKIRK